MGSFTVLCTLFVTGSLVSAGPHYLGVFILFNLVLNTVNDVSNKKKEKNIELS